MEDTKRAEYKNVILESISDIWIMSGRIVTAISLVILPLIVVGIVYYIREIVPPSSFYFDQFNNLQNSVLPPILFSVLKFFFYFEIFAFAAILLLYPPYPLPCSPSWYFEKRGYSRAVKEYEFVKNVLIITVPILIAFTTLGIIHDLRFPPPVVAPVSSPLYFFTDIIHPHIYTFNVATIVLFIIVASGILKMIIARVRPEFWLYYARGCFVQMQNHKNDMDEIRYFVKGLNSYNSYVRRQTKLEIKDLGKFVSKIASFEQVEKNEIIGKFAFFFSSDEMVNKDTLYPLREISNLLGIPKESDLLVGQSIRNRLMEWGAVAAAIIPVAIQTFSFISPVIKIH